MIDTRPRPEDVSTAFGLLSRIPAQTDPERMSASGWAWPLVGASIAAFAGLVAWAFGLIGLTPGIIAVLVLVAQIMPTGAMHEDGLGDCADAFWGGNNRERRLEILKDSAIGTYGVLALSLSLILRWSAIVALIGAGAVIWPLVAAAALSRAPMVVLLNSLANARGSGLSHSVGHPQMRTGAMACGIATLIALLTTGFAGLAATIAVTLITVGMALLARAKIGGQTGDVLGATQQLCEVVALITFVALI